MGRMSPQDRLARACRVLEGQWPKVQEATSTLEGHVTLPDLDAIRRFTLHDDADPLMYGQPARNFVFAAPGARFSAPNFRFMKSGNVVIICDNADLGSTTVSCKSLGLVILGAGIRLRRCEVFLSGRNNTFLMGGNTTWEGGGLTAAEEATSVVIGDNCMMSSDITGSTSDSHSIFDRTTGERINPARSIVIERGVWVGRGVRIGKGCRLGEGGVIGQGAVVTRSTEPFCISAGVPAKTIRRDVAWRRSLRIRQIGGDDEPADSRND